MNILSYNGIRKFEKQDDLNLWNFFLNQEKFKENKKVWDLLGKKYGKKKLFDLFFLASEREDTKQNIVGFLIKVIFNVKSSKKLIKKEDKKTKKNIKNVVKKKEYEKIGFQNQVLDLFFKFKWLFFSENNNKDKYLDKFKEYKELKLQKRKDTAESIKNKIMRTLYYKRKRS